jgi:pseudouridine synthase
MTAIRLQLVLAKAGVASRRAAESLITAGRVAVNGQPVTELGSRVDPIADRITVDGREVQREAAAYFLLNKPKGYVTTAADPEGRQTVFDLLPTGQVRLFAVGRLDYNTEGALLLTNDGELAHALMHPSRGVTKVYDAKLRGRITPQQVDRLRLGVVLPPPRPLDSTGRPIPSPFPQTTRLPTQVETSAPCEVNVRKETGQHTWLEFVLHEGKNRQIHRMAEAIGSSLLKLQRVQYAGLSIADLPIGEVRPLSRREVAELRRGVGLTASLAEPGLPPATAAAEPPPPRATPRPAQRPTVHKPTGGAQLPPTRTAKSPASRRPPAGRATERPGRPGPRPPASGAPASPR